MQKNSNVELESIKMKAVEILTEAPAGTSFMNSLKGKVNSIANKRNERKEKLEIIKQNKQKWFDNVKKLQRANINMRNSEVYKDQLIKYLTSNNAKQLSNELMNKIKYSDLSSRSLTDIIAHAGEDRKKALTKLPVKTREYQIGDSVTYKNKKGETRTGTVSQQLSPTKIQLQIGNAKFAINKDQIVQ